MDIKEMDIKQLVQESVRGVFARYKALPRSTHDKLNKAVAFGYLNEDNGNFKATQKGYLFASSDLTFEDFEKYWDNKNSLSINNNNYSSSFVLKNSNNNNIKADINTIPQKNGESPNKSKRDLIWWVKLATSIIVGIGAIIGLAKLF